MASEYSVNIKLNTSQVKKDLKTIGDGIGNLGKKQSRGSKAALSDAEKQLKLENQSLRLQNQGLGLTLKALPLKKKGVDFETINLGITDGINKAKKFEFDLARKSLLLSDKEIKKEQILLKATEKITKSKATQVKLQRQMASPIGGSKFMMGSPAQMAFSGGPSVPIGGSRFITGSPAQLAHSARVGGPRSPIGGLASIPGSPAALKGRRGFDVQSALISGGFPLLFGQGPITAAAGAVGGGVGGMFGQMGGFAGGIAATAAVQSISNALNAVSELGRALSKPTENIQTLVDKLGLANTPTGDLALKLEKLGLTSSAASVLIEKFAEDFGRTPLEIEKMTKELDAFNQEMTKFGLRLQFIVADVFGPMVTLINKLPLGTIAKFFTARGFDFLNPGGATMPNVMTLPQKKLKAERKRGSGIQNNLPSTLQDVSAVADQLTFNREIKPLKQALEIEKLRLTTSSEKLNIMKEEFELENLTNELKIAQAENEKVSTDELTTKISKLTAQVDLQKQVVANAKALEDPFRKLSNIISMDIGNGIKGLIRGTSTLGDLLSNVLNKLSDAFLNLAIFGNFGGGSVTGGLLGAIGFANGGRPPVGRPSVVGERGPELFVPDRAGTIVPNHQLAGMGGTNIVVNVDASGSSVQGDEAESRELGRLISVAVQSELVKQKRPGGILA